jgi:osmoprotectant transport system ATP-binding protein
LVDSRDRPVSWPSRRQLGRLDVLGSSTADDLPVIGSGATLNDALDTMLVSSAGAALVTGRRDAFIGVITVEVVMEAITRARASAAETQHDAPVGTNTGSFDVVPGAPAPGEDAA